mmetsp:Transcript_4737/g.12415  ORF Transcript_4737/g.12415 Transcript_4737/m.12415 type:complete len:242 (+) Transcript_4737:520-1245(+)
MNIGCVRKQKDLTLLHSTSMRLWYYVTFILIEHLIQYDVNERPLIGPSRKWIVQRWSLRMVEVAVGAGRVLVRGKNNSASFGALCLSLSLSFCLSLSSWHQRRFHVDGVKAQSGNPSASSPVTHGMNVKAEPRMTTEEMILRTKPAFFISCNGKRPVEKTTMLGGVAIGRANAQLHAKVTGIMIVYGLVSSAMAREAVIGIMMFEVAVLDVSSVSQMMRVMTMNTMPAVDKESSPLSSSPK